MADAPPGVLGVDDDPFGPVVRPLRSHTIDRCGVEAGTLHACQIDFNRPYCSSCGGKGYVITSPEDGEDCGKCNPPSSDETTSAS